MPARHCDDVADRDVANDGPPAPVAAALVCGGVGLFVGMAVGAQWPDLDPAICGMIVWGGLLTFVLPLTRGWDSPRT